MIKIKQYGNAQRDGDGNARCDTTGMAIAMWMVKVTGMAMMTGMVMVMHDGNAGTVMAIRSWNGYALHTYTIMNYITYVCTVGN